MINKLTFLFLTSLSCLFILGSSCSDEKEEKNQKFEIAESELTQNVTQEETLLTIPVTTNLGSKEWTVTSDADWCVAAQSFGTTTPSIRVSIDSSGEVGIRTTSIKINSPVKNYTIQVSQLGCGAAILLKSSEPTIDAAGGNVTITVTTNVEYDCVVSKGNDWVNQVITRGIVEYNHTFSIETNPDYDDRLGEIAFTYKADNKVKAVCSVTQKSRPYSTSDVKTEGDIHIKPIGATSSEAQPGSEIKYTYDGIIGGEKHYHSRWGDKTVFPVMLEYSFDGNETIDYFIYHSRSGNGNFGELKVYTANADTPGNYELQGSYNFNMQNAPSKIEFPTPIKAVKVKFEVNTGLGGYVSCSEIQFFKTNTDKQIDKQLLTVFADLTCSELKEGITSTQINKLPGYFARIATALKNNSYDAYEKQFRIRDYHPYSDTEVWRERLMTKRYTILDNPTGIHATAGDSIVILVGNTHGQTLTLQSIPSVEPNGDSYFLEEGVNKIGIRNTGMLFLIYQTDLTSSNAVPIRVHIPLGSGKVDGFFDLKEHKTDEKYADILSKATYKYFCVRGEKIMFYFHRTKMVDIIPAKILPAITLWDNFIGWQQELMGIDDVRPSQVNNHIFAISPEDSYMWASDYRIAFNYTVLDKILIGENVMAAKDHAWGPAHEIGHVHQEAIDWPSSTESSNNLFSNYTLYKLGKYCSRGSELSELATVRFTENRPWCNFGEGHQSENTELHMRMNWQLWNYYHRCEYKKNYFQTLFNLLRENRVNASDPGAKQLHFAKMACQAANQNLTDFFETWGFFEPVNMTIEQYGTYQYTVTDAMIRDAKSFMSKFPIAKHAFYYLEDRKNGDVGIDNYKVGDVGHYTQFKNNQKITKTVTYSRSGQRISIHNGEEAVAFEIHKDGKRVFFFNFLIFEAPASISLDNVRIYAVQADGQRFSVTIN